MQQKMNLYEGHKPINHKQGTCYHRFLLLSSAAPLGKNNDLLNIMNWIELIYFSTNFRILQLNLLVYEQNQLEPSRPNRK